MNTLIPSLASNSRNKLRLNIVSAVLGVAVALSASSALASNCCNNCGSPPAQEAMRTQHYAGQSLTGDITALALNERNVFVRPEQGQTNPYGGPAISLSSTALTFPVTTVGSGSGTQNISVTNTGTSSLYIYYIDICGDFSYTTNCQIDNNQLLSGNEPTVVEGGSGGESSSEKSLNANASCNISVKFSPLGSGVRTGDIYISNNANSQSISLTGTGTTVTEPTALLSPGNITFASQTINSISAPQAIVLSNDGTANLNMSVPTVSSNFSLSSAVPNLGIPVCDKGLAPGKQCYYSVVFSPAVLGNLSGTFSITDNASGSPHMVSLSGISTPVPQPNISVPAAVTFADQITNTTSAAQTLAIGNSALVQLTVTNTTAATLLITSISLGGTNGGEFTLSGTCTSIAPGASCNLSTTFKPTANGIRTATVTIVSNSQLKTGTTSTTSTITLTGRGVPVPVATARVSATSLGFGNVIYGTSVSAPTVTLSNVGGLPLNVTSISSSGGDFTPSNNCPASLTTDQACTISITFSPRGLGPRTGVLQIISNGANSPTTIQFSGNGCRYFSPAAARFFLTSC